MDIWNAYESRIAVHGTNKKDAALKREIRFINSHLPDNISYCTVEVLTQEFGYNIETAESKSHRLTQNVAIIDSDNLNQKVIISMPGEDIRLGSLILWGDNYWLVHERDANSTLYVKAKLLQCNHLLKWITDDKEIIEQWCVIEDGTKYLTGELEDRNFVVTRGDSRISVQLARNKYTIALSRKNRFLIDDDDSPHKLSYLLTKPLKCGLTYNNDGTFKFVMQEVTATEYDNHDLGIADYYRYFERDMSEKNVEATNCDETEDSPSEQNNTGSQNGKKVWI